MGKNFSCVWGFCSDATFARVFLCLIKLIAGACMGQLYVGCLKKQGLIKKNIKRVTFSQLQRVKIMRNEKLFVKETLESSDNFLRKRIFKIAVITCC